MLGASLYIIVCSARNRLRVRLRRLKEPRYLIGAVAALAYFYFTIFARMWGQRAGIPQGRRRATPPRNFSVDAFRTIGPTFVGMALLLRMAAGWLFPGDGGLLDFSAAETQFLFPAPVTRRALLVHRLMRSQIGLLFASIVPALVFPSGSAGSRAKFAVSMWLILVTMKVHFTGITLARASLGLRGADVKRRQWGALAVMLGAVAIVGGTAMQAFVARPANSIREVIDRLGDVGATGASHWILWPFMALAKPLFAEWPGPYLLAMGAAIAVLAANVVWVLWSDEAFQEAAAEAEARRAAKKLRDRPVVRARTVGWTLAPSGRTETLFVWKNAVQMLRGTTGVTAVRYIAPAAGVTVGVTSALMAATRASGAAAVCGMLALALAAFTIVLGPQIARSDLREDLLHLELLKTWPIAAPALIRGEMLAPAAMLTIVAWIAIACALVMSAAAFTAVSLTLRASIAATIAVLAPAIIAAQLTVHNAAAILFPAWVPLGNQRPKGLDAMGQRLILFFGIVLALILMLLPGVLPAGIVWLAFHRLLGYLVLVPAAAALTIIVLMEVLIATEALGPAYDRLDLTAVERAE